MKLFISYIRELFVQFLKLKSTNKSKELSKNEPGHYKTAAQRYLGKTETTRDKSLASYVLYLATIKILFCVCLAHARQSSSPEAAHGVALSTDSIKPLQIGDTIPEALWHMPLQMVKAGQEGSATITLNDYRGKLIILDFWATYCSPCVAAFPKMDSLRKRFYEDLAIIPISLQDQVTIGAFLLNMQKKTRLSGFSLVNEKPLLRFFPHQEIPHYVWISRDGTVKAVTDGAEVNSDNINAILAGKQVALRSKEDVYRKFDFDDYLLSGKNEVSKASVLTHSALTTYVEGFPARFGLRNFGDDSAKRLYALNISIAKLFRIAYSELDVTLMHDNRFKLAVRDSNAVMTSLRGDPFRRWVRKHTCCYELVSRLSRESMFERMRYDLQENLPYVASIEPEEMDCFVLKRTEQKKIGAAKGKTLVSHNAFNFTLRNASWHYLPQYLSVYYLQNQPPILDETGLDGPVDLELQCKMSSIDDLNKALAEYGLHISRERRELGVIILRDK